MADDMTIVKQPEISLEGYGIVIPEGTTLNWARRKLLLALLDPQTATDSITNICIRAGVSRETYYVCAKDETFTNLLQETVKAATKGRSAKYVHLLEKFAEEGSFPHLRVLLAMSGLYDEKMTIELEPIKAVLKPRAVAGD